MLMFYAAFGTVAIKFVILRVEEVMGLNFRH